MAVEIWVASWASVSPTGQCLLAALSEMGAEWTGTGEGPRNANRASSHPAPGPGLSWAEVFGEHRPAGGVALQQGRASRHLDAQEEGQDEAALPPHEGLPGPLLRETAYEGRRGGMLGPGRGRA